MQISQKFHLLKHSFESYWGMYFTPKKGGKSEKEKDRDPENMGSNTGKR